MLKVLLLEARALLLEANASITQMQQDMAERDLEIELGQLWPLGWAVRGIVRSADQSAASLYDGSHQAPCG
ncbi:hypothetical protein OMK73_10615 [Cupriavidus sp. D39]|nr:hypothetical protein [Cupriavidus sp. D39]MCY0854163.1 hypothetical protein [Cupriavidus sp. D39]